MIGLGCLEVPKWQCHSGIYLVTRLAASSKSQIASDSNRNSKKLLRLRKHPLKLTLWTWHPPGLCVGFIQVWKAPTICCDYKAVIPNRCDFLAQCDLCDCDTAILLGFLQLATSKLWLPIAGDLWLWWRGSLSRETKDTPPSPQTHHTPL